jgi:hypothetical protein
LHVSSTYPIKRTIARLAILGQLDELGGKYVLAREPEED